VAALSIYKKPLKPFLPALLLLPFFLHTKTPTLFVTFSTRRFSASSPLRG
jgi:hypothetical protein